MSDSDFIATSRKICRSMTRHHAKTFYFASHVLPAAKRRDAYAVYAFCRYVDDRIDLAIDDAARHSAFIKLTEVLEIAFCADKPPDSIHVEQPWLLAFRETINRRSIPKKYFEDLLSGVRMDCGRVRIETWPELEKYCYHVASVVGLIMVHVLTKPSDDLLKPAQHLGTAMQLTNILRDIGEDWALDRLYLPRTELGKFGLSEQDIALHRVSDPFQSMMRFQIGRARSYYGLAQPGIAALPGDGSQLTVRLMSRIYGGILDEIERAEYQIYQQRVRVSLPRKMLLALNA